MRFWDSSALVPLLVTEPSSGTVARLLRDDPEVVVAWTATVECASACVRRHREGAVSPRQLAATLTRLRQLSDYWNIAEPTPALRSLAEKLVVRHGLRTGDAIQLASASVAAEGADAALEFVCFDEELGLAATAEGLHVIPEAAC